MKIKSWANKKAGEFAWAASQNKTIANDRATQTV
jgi:hypothetical protein